MTGFLFPVMVSVLVTGATGFIGSRLVSELVKMGIDVTTLVRPGKHTEEKTEEIVGDLTKDDFDFGEKHFDCVFHLASHTPLEKNAKVLENVNLNGTKNLFSKLRTKTKAMIYVSGLGVYGDVGDKVIEDTQSYDPNTKFVKIRVEAQRFLEAECKQNAIDFAVVHFGDVYGSKGWFSEMVIKRLQNNSFKLPGGGKYFKGFVHVDDAVGSMIAIFEKKAYGRTYIIADNLPVTFKDFVDFTAEKIGAKKPGSVPSILAKAVLGGDLIKLLTTSMKVKNQRISEIYKFKYPSYKEGIPQVLSELGL